MIFRRQAPNLNYFLPVTDAKAFKLFVFTDKDIEEFSLADALAGRYPENFLLIFYREKIDYSPLAREILLEKVRDGSRIYWLDGFGSNSISASSYIYFRQNKVAGFSNLGIGGNDPNVQLLHRGTQGTIALDAARTRLVIQPAAGRFFELAAHSIDSQVGAITIPLRNDMKVKVGKQPLSAGSGLGSLNFQVLRKGIIELLQPVSPYFIGPGNTTDPRSVKVYYFDKASYNDNADVFVSLQPFKKAANIPDAFSSYMEVVYRNDTDTNFSDEKGRRFYVKKNNKTVCRIASLEYNANDESTKRFFFIPEDGQTLTLFQNTADSGQLLAGFSGTEAFAVKDAATGTQLTFRETANVSIDKPSGSLTTSGDSKTALIEIGKRAYSLDSERLPIFLNTTLEPAYTFVNRGQLADPVAMPMVPTFSFRNNTDLEELEEVFRKVRLKLVTAKLKHKKLVTKSGMHITPQGFLKDGTTYDLIKNGTKRKQAHAGDIRGLFRFTLTDNKEDLDTSIRKDEVFFVMTPGLYKAYKSAVLNARFAINNSSNADELFQLDLTSLFDSATEQEHDNSIIIFKFHKKSLGSLLKDTTQWSNNGKILGNQTSLREVLKQISDKELLKIDDPYFTNSILNDPNWNGVVVLNVPITNADQLPRIFTGLSNSQRLNKNSTETNKLEFNTDLNFRYVAFPVNKTTISGSSVAISSTSFYGMIDYNPFEDKGDYKKIAAHFDNKDWKFVLSKLKVRFANSKIAFFEAFSFLQVPKLFEDTVKFEPFVLSHGDDGKTDKKPNLVRLKGSYQKSSDSAGQFLFDAELNGKIEFGGDAILKAIAVSRIGFSYDAGSKNFRFDLDASAVLSDWKMSNFISIRKLDFSNIGLTFQLEQLKLPSLKFDLSRLFVLPQIDFNCDGFLSSFPIRFSHFKGFKLKKSATDKIDIDYDFFTLPGFKVPGIDVGGIASFFSLVFDFDLGTLGNLAALKALKGQLLFGWSIKGGFAMGLKIAGPSTDGFHIDLFGALKLDIQKVEFCQVKNQYMLKLINARMTVLGMELPPEEDQFSALIFAGKGSKVAWLMSYVNGNNPDVTKNKLALGIGQRVGIPDVYGITSVDQAITAMKKIFDPATDGCRTGKFPDGVYAPERNWLVGSENFIPEAWKDVFDLKFVFNDPVLYGVFLRIVGLLDVEILYKKIADDLGVWSLEIAPDPAIRNIEMGAASVTLPNLGVDMYTNGDWRGDIGYPRTTDDWSRSCLIQIRPFVGWAGFYIARLRNAALSLFAQYLPLLPKAPGNPGSKPGDGVSIIQAGFAFRIGIGAYIDKGIFYVGASISVYGIMEGAFAFNKGERGVKKLFPDHFALRGRIGAIAELVGYVDFKIIKAAIHLILRVEFGLLIALISGKLQPVPIYIEGNVSVRVSVTICCFRIFRKKICIVLHFSFQTTVRFPYTLGAGSKRALAAKRKAAALAGPITVAFGEIPVTYVPAIVKTGEKGNQLIHQFAINFFGCAFDGNKLQFSQNNILKDRVIRPIITAVLNAGVKHYLTMREVFLEGPGGSNIQFEVSSFTPVLLTGFNDVTDRAFLKDRFLFSENEIDSFIALNNTASCGTGTNQCPYRMVPVPVTSKLKVVDKSGTVFETDKKGFSITLKGLFKDAAGTSIPVLLDVKREETYTDTQIELINRHFDAYASQFIDRSKAKALTTAGGKDIREDFILPEYFKMMGLLTLEAYFSFLAGKPENRGNEEFNPEIKLTELFADTGDWIFNDQLEGIIGQLNYFYNNGLRLPDMPAATQTKAYYEALKLNNAVHAVDPHPDFAHADIVLTKSGTTTSVSLKEDMFTDAAGLAEFAGAAGKNLSVDLAAVAREFSKPKAELPYILTDVQLGVANSITNTKDGTTPVRFFDVPARVAQHFKKDIAALALSVVSNADNTARPLDFTPCINITAKVKPHLVGSKTKVAELINVYVNDLTLMHKVMESGLRFRKISVYLKTENKEGVQLLPLIKPGEETKTRIVRANLSPKTHPPIIIDQPLPLKNTATEQYVANLTEQETFIKVLWQALTTNNGGYYLVESPDSDLFAQMPVSAGNAPVLDYTLVFSFESEAGKPFSAIHNYLRISDDGTLFKNLDASSHSLSAGVMQQVNKRDGGKVLQTVPLQEYHARIPAHCFAFSLERNTPDTGAGHDKYLPVEFDIKGNADITRDKVLPLMPLERTPEGGTTPVPGKLFYSHVSPLHKVTNAANKDRYKNIGRKFNLKFGLRDTSGFRALDLPHELEYSHIYFDKLVPLSAWPIVTCSYWFKEFKSNELVFELKVRAFHKGQVIAGEEKQEIRNMLHTAIAQLSDANVSVKLNYATSTDLKALLLGYLNHALDNLDNPKPKESTAVYFRIKADAGFTKVLAPEITIARPGNDSLYPDLPSTVWDKAQIRTVVTGIVATNPAEQTVTTTTNVPVVQKDTIRPLNDAISAGASPYALGLGTNTEGEKVMFLVRKDYITAISVPASPVPRSQYFGIMPYSNQRFSGKYTPTAAGSAEHSFTNIDLDKGLNLVLTKIDALLSPARINTLGVPDSAGVLYAQKLVATKKMLVESELFNKTDNIDAPATAEEQERLREEFRLLLLSRLANFYAYDGIINLNADVPSAIKPRLDGYRLTVATGKDRKYDIVSSKIAFTGKKWNWAILFDQMERGENIELEFTPEITHIETDIVPMGGGIEKSTWIQLVTAIPLKSAINTKHSAPEKQWPSINRSFPASPLIREHRAAQVPRSGKLTWSANTDLGQWQYIFRLDDPYEPNDQLDIDIRLKDNGVFRTAANTRNFKGFIAYWSSRFDSADYNDSSFIDDLARQMDLEMPAVKAATGEKVYNFRLLKSSGGWTVEKSPDISFNIKVITDNTDKSVTVILDGDGFDIFQQTKRVTAVKPEIKALRNRRLKNDAFVYVTDKVAPAMWAVPHIRFDTPVKMDTGLTLQTVFNKIATLNLPYKATARFLLNTTDLDNYREARVPAIPLMQMELAEKSKPAISPVDKLFDGIYQNGYPALALTVFNDEANENDLPLFSAATIFKTGAGKKAPAAKKSIAKSNKSTPPRKLKKIKP